MESLPRSRVGDMRVTPSVCPAPIGRRDNGSSLVPTPHISNEFPDKYTLDCFIGFAGRLFARTKEYVIVLLLITPSFVAVKFVVRTCLLACMKSKTYRGNKKKLDIC